MDDLVDSLACGDDVEHGKPDPRLIGFAVRKLEIPAGQAVMIGDTPYDAEAASGAGTAAAGLLTGGFAEKTLTEAGCIVVAKDLRDLTNSFGITAALHGTDAADRVRGANSARHVSRRSH